MKVEMHKDVRDAAAWFAARRRGVMSVAERTRHEEWLSDPVNGAAMDEMENVWAMLGQTDSVSAAAPTAPRGRAAMLAVMCAASLAICVLSLGTNSHFWTALDWTSR